MSAAEINRTLDEAVAALRAGEIVAFPTETFYGLAVDPESPAALERLIAAKGREPDKPIALIAPDSAAAFALFREVPPAARRLAERFWPGPLTLVMPARAGLHPALIGEYGVGVRVSPHAVASALARGFGRSITATSANLAGRPATTDAAEVRRTFNAKLKVLLEYTEPPRHTSPSTVVTLVGDTIKVLREGALELATLRAALNG